MRPFVFDAERNVMAVGTSRSVFHCHHYNLFLQRTIADALPREAAALSRAAALESTRLMFEQAGLRETASFEGRVAQAGELFRELGFGLADATALGPFGGDVTLRTSHYAIGHRAKWGAAKEPVCHFAVGFWAAVVAVSVAPERVVATEVRCAAVDADTCSLHYEVR